MTNGIEIYRVPVNSEFIELTVLSGISGAITINSPNHLVIINTERLTVDDGFVRQTEQHILRLLQLYRSHGIERLS